MNVKDKYENFRDYIRNYDEFRAQFKTSKLIKDPEFGPVIRMMEMIRKIDDYHNKIKTISEKIDQIEEKLIPVIKQVIEISNEQTKREVEKQEDYAEMLTESYEKHIKGYPEIESHYNGIVPTKINVTVLHGRKFTGNVSIGEIKNGLFTPVSIDEFENAHRDRLFEFFVRVISSDNLDEYEYFFLLAISTNHEMVVTCSPIDSLIEDFKLQSFEELFE